MAQSLPLVICPACHYGFPDRDLAVTQFDCPRAECGHRWEALTETIRAVHGDERREALPELIVTAGASPRRIEIPEGETIIGREPGCGFEIDNRMASRRHARIVRRGSQITIEDLQSSCGTLVNDQYIEAITPLTARDEVVIGGSVMMLAVRFVASSSRPEIADSATVLARGKRASAPQFQGRATDVVPLELKRITIGRAPDRDLVLSDPMLSGKHALLESVNGDWFLCDAQSRIGTFVNGQSVIRTKLSSGDRVQFGPYLFRFDGDRLTRIAQPTSFGVVAEDVVKATGSVTLLDQINLVLQPGEFVGLIGPSGAGKTTLLDALNGLRPASSGRVLINGEPLYEQYDRLRHHIGYVPQDDIIHRELTVRQALTHAARLRLPEDIEPDELQRAVDDSLETLQMSHRADVPISLLSGGQRKRVSVGVELLSQPGILFLDEPTSGLDPGTETRLMKLFRRLADQGRTVVCTTHVMENVDLFHKLVVLAPGGKLAYFGPPQLAKTHFEIVHFTDLYEPMETKTPDEWQRRYCSSVQNVTQASGAASVPRSNASTKNRFNQQETGGLTPPRSPVMSRARSVSFSHQCLALLRRSWDLSKADRTGLLLLIAQPVMITALICLVCSELPTIVFLLVISALWFGCSNAAQQIVKERAIYRRERMVNLRLDAYLLSKFVPLVIVGAIQSSLMLTLLALCEESVRALEMVAAAVFMATWCGASMGLIISALASNPDKAMSIVPLSLIPQIILAGVLVPLPEMNAPTRWLSYVTAARWANQAGEVGLLQEATITSQLVQDRAWTRPLWNLYPDYDFNDVKSQQRFLADHVDKPVFRHERWLLDEVVLAGFLLGQLLLTTGILRSQDVL